MIPLTDSGLTRRRFPYVNVAFISINALVFLYELTLGGDRSVFYYTYGMIPDEFTSSRAFEILRTSNGTADIATPFPTWGTLFSAMFIHGGLMHFGSNMLYLWGFGDNVESRMGHVPYHKVRTLVIFYFITVVHIPAALLLGTWLLLQFWSGLGSLAGGAGIAYWAHIGGFLTGMATVALFRIVMRRQVWPGRPPPPPVPWQ